MSLFKKKKIEKKREDSSGTESLGRSFYAILADEFESQTREYQKLKDNVKCFAEMVVAMDGHDPQRVNFDDVKTLGDLNDRFEKALETFKRHVVVSEHQPGKTEVVVTKNIFDGVNPLIYPLGKKDTNKKA